MLYALVVLGIPVEGPFDYIVPENLCQKIKVGARAWVDFRNKKMLGFIVRLTKKTKIQNIKPILELIDDSPVLDKNMLLITKRLSDYYCCSWGEAIETALPEALRKGKKIANIARAKYTDKNNNPEVTLVHDLDGRARWDIYLKSIREALASNQSVIVLLPDINSVLKAREIIIAHLNIQPALLYRKESGESEEWLRIKEGKFSIVIGTRSAIFAPLNNLGLVIIDEEQNDSYKQGQVPHYHAREASLMRTSILGARLILGSGSPTLESFYLAKRNKIGYLLIPQRKNFPEMKIIDAKYGGQNLKQKNMVLSKYLADAVVNCLNSKGKALLFLNRKGFATFASCLHCGAALRCPRCNINLVYHFKDNIVNCHYCNFKMPAPKICPNCNSGYIKYSGIGTEKIESELSRIFTQARIKRLDSLDKIDIKGADIFISTQSIIKEADCSFDLVGVLAIDNTLNRIDFRASEKTFELLVALSGLTEKKIVIQTRLASHHCFQALVDKNIDTFYNKELKQRKELNFPPFKHLGLVKLRGEKESKVREISNVLFEGLNKNNKNKTIEIVAVSPAYPSKLRGKFCWQILIKVKSAPQITKFLKKYLKDFAHSGIIVTVDIDPV